MVTPKPVKIFNLIIIVLFSFSCSCSVRYTRMIEKTDNDFYAGNFEKALLEIRPLAKRAKSRDLLLYLMEAGAIFHTMGNYQKSNEVFRQADEIAESFSTSISNEAMAFILSDEKKNFQGENFERVLIKYFIAVNYIMLGDLQNSKRYFRKMDFDLKEMKYFDSFYKQNLAVRYLDAMVSEFLQEYNDARVQYKNIQSLAPPLANIEAARYVLAVKENDKGDQAQYYKNKDLLDAYNANLKKIDYSAGMGELIIIYHAGMAPVKKSRGLLFHDKKFKLALRVAIEIALASRNASLSLASIMTMIALAENPVPVYIPRGSKINNEVDIVLNNVNLGSANKMFDFSQVVIKNFQENYRSMVTKNISALAAKIVVAALAADALGKIAKRAARDNLLLGSLGEIAAGLTMGGAVAATTKPDLRCWRLLPANIQIKRIFLEPGEYDLKLDYNQANYFTTFQPQKIIIESKKPKFIVVRGFPGMAHNNSESDQRIR